MREWFKMATKSIVTTNKWLLMSCSGILPGILGFQWAFYL